ncbi:MULTISPECIES: FAD binding domain-containing protein [unclassified Streptomyces]|uniref:FAD binding domain-containing protein n=1 Tax=unclassified Streptomyces TaxID=2593676 RepID=UPI0009979F55|nr:MULTISPECIES: FAD binding domain-containing protein [unclassified Streptomyces]MYY05937.1 hypothetical protein [Streptomyces sp. SID4913]
MRQSLQNDFIAVKPAPFCYHRPTTRDEVDALLAQLPADVYLLAGGQSLVPALNSRTIRPVHIVDLNHLRNEPRHPVAEKNEFRIGPLVRISALLGCAELLTAVPVAGQLLRSVATVPVRNRATVIGNMMCGESAAELPALAALLDARVVTRGPGGSTRTRPLTERTSPRHDRVAGGPADGEWVSELLLSRPAPGTRMAFEESGRRFAATAVAGAVAAAGRTADGRSSLRVAVFGAGTKPLQLAAEGPAGTAPHHLAEQIGHRVRSQLVVRGDVHAPADYRLRLACELSVSVSRRVLTGTGG